ncbi:hypothetical protein DAPPUDRAFT_275108, partial [Daphnia pulex]
MERILNVCKKYLAGTTKAQDIAFYVSEIYLTRPDVKDSYLPGFINWAHEVLTKDSAQFKKGVLSTLAGVFKHGQREQMMWRLAIKVLASLSDLPKDDSNVEYNHVNKANLLENQFDMQFK